ncbi:MAG: hypothetical protein KME49_10130 [Brasilonema octagenarum HA4186-MV1]|nr:hypothetical protein [Brasilonema octagenarum HA4186-MV1]
MTLGIGEGSEFCSYWDRGVFWDGEWLGHATRSPPQQKLCSSTLSQLYSLPRLI